MKQSEALLWTGTIFGFCLGFAVGYYVALMMIV